MYNNVYRTCIYNVYIIMYIYNIYNNVYIYIYRNLLILCVYMVPLNNRKQIIFTGIQVFQKQTRAFCKIKVFCI